MNEKKKGQILLLIGLIIVICFVSIIVIDSKKQAKLVNEYYQLYEVDNENLASAFGDNNVVMEVNEDKYSIVFFGATGCSYCQMYQPVIDEIAELYGLNYYYVNTANLSQDKLVEMLEKGGVSVEDFGTPTTVIIKNGEAVANNIGYMDREATFEFFQENGLISEDEVLPPEYENLTEISYNEYSELIKSTEPKVIVVGQTSCSHCIAAKPYYDEIARENDIDIYYLNFTKMTADEQEAIQTSLTYFKENTQWGTPLMLIVKDGDNIAVDSGFLDKQTVVDFLTENSIIK